MRFMIFDESEKKVVSTVELLDETLEYVRFQAFDPQCISFRDEILPLLILLATCVSHDRRCTEAPIS